MMDRLTSFDDSGRCQCQREQCQAGQPEPQAVQLHSVGASGGSGMVSGTHGIHKDRPRWCGRDLPPARHSHAEYKGVARELRAQIGAVKRASQPQKHSSRKFGAPPHPQRPKDFPTLTPNPHRSKINQ